jgi:hypothetical protein
MPRRRGTPASDLIRRHLLLVTAYFIHTVTVVLILYSSPNYYKQPYHNSAMTGEMWVQELVYGHPECIRTELGLHLHVFLALEYELRVICALADSRYVSLREKLAIFLYMCVTGLSVGHVGERFQRSNETISKYAIT